MSKSFMWSDLFKGPNRDVPFKSKQEGKENEKPSVRPDVNHPRSPASPRSPHPNIEAGYKTPPPKLTPLDDTIASIQKAQHHNREQKSSTPKTPQTPRPPTIHLEPVNDDSCSDQTFSVDWKLDNVMVKPVKSQSIKPLDVSSKSNPNPWIIVEPKVSLHHIISHYQLFEF